MGLEFALQSSRSQNSPSMPPSSVIYNLYGRISQWLNRKPKDTITNHLRNILHSKLCKNIARVLLPLWQQHLIKTHFSLEQCSGLNASH